MHTRSRLARSTGLFHGVGAPAALALAGCVLGGCGGPADQIPDPASLNLPAGIEVRAFPTVGTPFECSDESRDCSAGECETNEDEIVCCDEASTDCLVSSMSGVTCEGGGCLIHGTGTGTRSCGPERPCWYVLEGTGQSDCPSGGCVFVQNMGTGTHTCDGGGCTYFVDRATGGYGCDGGNCLFVVTDSTGEYTCSGGDCDFVLEDAIGTYRCGPGGCTFCKDGACEPCEGECAP